MHALHKTLLTPPVLYLSDFHKAFQVETDASDFVIGGILS